MTLGDKIVVAPGVLVIVWSTVVYAKDLNLRKMDDRQRALAIAYAVMALECLAAAIFCGFAAFVWAEGDLPASYFFKWLITMVMFGALAYALMLVAEKLAAEPGKLPAKLPEGQS